MTTATGECSVCTHELADEIDAELLAGTPLRQLEGRWGLSRSALQRHKARHLSAAAVSTPVEPDRGALELVDVVQELTSLAERLEKAMTAAERSRKLPAMVQAARERRACLADIGRLQADPAFKSAASDVTKAQAQMLADIIRAVVALFDRDPDEPSVVEAIRAVLAGFSKGEKPDLVAWWSSEAQRAAQARPMLCLPPAPVDEPDVDVDEPEKPAHEEGQSVTPPLTVVPLPAPAAEPAPVLEGVVERADGRCTCGCLDPPDYAYCSSCYSPLCDGGRPRRYVGRGPSPIRRGSLL